MAVPIFFVISGFIMTYKTREKGETSRFLKQRLIRIVPMYWLGTLGILLLGALQMRGLTWESMSLENIVKSFLFIPYINSYGAHLPLLAVGWTLNIEMLFYLLFSTMLAVSWRWAPVLVSIALIAILLAAQQFDCTTVVCQIYAHPYLIYFIEGILLCYVWSSLENHVQNRPWLVASFSVMVVLLFVLWTAHPPFTYFLQQWLNFPLNYLIPPFLVLAALVAHSAGLRITWAPANILGDASYALYLTHGFVLSAMLKIAGTIK